MRLPCSDRPDQEGRGSLRGTKITHDDHAADEAPRLPQPFRQSAASAAAEERAARTAEDRRLLERYHRQGDRAARDAIVARFLPLARQLARRYSGAGEPLDDLIQVASLGLVKAVDRFDPDRAVAFSSFAVPTILGELKRHFRDKGWSVRVPRDLQELALRLERVAEELSRELARAPTPAELAARLGVSEEDVLEAREAAHAYRAVSLDKPRTDDEDSGPNVADAMGGEDPGFGRAEDAATVDQLLRVLAPREREVLRLRFVEDLTQQEIGERIGVSQMHVSRLIRQAISRLGDAAQD
jgi:RNA polymerase sigma-B factor